VTAPKPETRGTPAAWWARPVVVIPTTLALALGVAVLTPQLNDARSGDARLSTLTDGPLGARLLYDLSERLGWTVSRRMAAEPVADPTAIQAVLSPVVALRNREVHALLEHARNGGGLLVAAGAGIDQLLDSLRLSTATIGYALPRERTEETCAAEPEARWRFTSLWRASRPVLLSFDWRGPAPNEVVTFLEVEAATFSDSTPAGQQRRVSALIGFNYGAGRVVVAADPDIFRTDAMRECANTFDVAAVRALEFLRDGGATPRTQLVFDEYHQGHGAHPGSLRAAIQYFSGTPTGRFFAQLALAGLVLLVALAPRVVPPAADRRIERRSPVEQVDALARAYEQVRATQTAAQRLVRGLRRRLQRRTVTRDTQDDDHWLSQLATRAPALAEDVALARRALNTSLSPSEFVELGPAIHRIESTLTRR